jgi:hypothetical protein
VTISINGTRFCCRDGDKGRRRPDKSLKNEKCHCSSSSERKFQGGGRKLIGAIAGPDVGGYPTHHILTSMCSSCSSQPSQIQHRVITRFCLYAMVSWTARLARLRIRCADYRPQCLGAASAARGSTRTFMDFQPATAWDRPVACCPGFDLWPVSSLESKQSRWLNGFPNRSCAKAQSFIAWA